MITGDIHHLEAYEKQLPPFISQCLRAVRDFDFASVPDGKYELLGCTMSVESPATEPEEDRKLEGHKKFIDIQYEIRGEEEWIGVETIFDSPRVVESYEDRDLYFFASHKGKESKVYLRKADLPYFSRKTCTVPSARGSRERKSSERRL